MNQNQLPYGQQLPIQPAQRRHDGSYAPIPPPHLRPHAAYAPYYAQQIAPMLPQYPQHFAAPGWYPYQQQQHLIPIPRPYYAQSPIPAQQFPHPHPLSHPHPHPPIPSAADPVYHSSALHSPDPSSLSPSIQRVQQHQQQQPLLPQQPHPPQPQLQPQQLPSPRPAQSHPQQKQLPSSASTTSTALTQTPPSRPLSTSTAVSARKEPVGPPPTQDAPPQAISTEPRPFVPPTPWLSFEGAAFPPRAPPRRRRIPRSSLATLPIEYPVPEPTQPSPVVEDVEPDHNKPEEEQEQQTSAAVLLQQQHQQRSTETPTPLASDVPSEPASTQPTTPISSLPVSTTKSQQTPTQPKTKPVGPVIPLVPVLSHSPASTRRAQDSTSGSQPHAPPTPPPVTSVAETVPTKQEDESAEPPQQPVEAAAPAPALPPKPTSWANLFRPSAAATTAAPLTMSNVNGVATAKGETLTEVLNDIHVPNEGPRRLSFLQPRGLVNTGNMCYMNSVLQVLVFCTPFYDFLSKIARRAAHTFKSDTPLIDAIILFMQEYPVLESAPSAEQLCKSLKPDDYEKYGDPFVPEYVYSAIGPLPRFRDMRRGHQQDAQEFLGLLLEELHDECSRAMRSGTSTSSGRTTPAGSAPSAQGQADNDQGWMEVGHKQKPAVTRSSGNIAADSPVTNIFGGKLRSELKVAGNKLSVTLEPYSPLQLDIGSPEVSNIIDALKGLTKPESMQGEFQTSKGQRSTATKQVFIETLPPVLILHLKRFHYDHVTKRAEKIWKKVGYPLELEIPKEVFPIVVRNKLAAHGGLPRYRLTAVIYHHGKNANGGHYTVDIRRQDGKQWIRMDDTVIRRVRSEDVAEAGSEEDPKLLAAALERHKQGKNPANRFEQIELADETDDHSPDRAWSQVNGHSRSKSTATATAAVNGAATPLKTSGPHTPREKLSIKDNKVAYLLFYQRVST